MWIHAAEAQTSSKSWPSLRLCYGQLNGHGEADLIRKVLHNKKVPCPVRAQPCGLDLHLTFSLAPWRAGQGTKQASKPLCTQSCAPCCPHRGYDAASLQSASLPSQKQWGIPKPKCEHDSSCLASESPGEKVLCFHFLCHTLRGTWEYTALLHISTLGNANTLPSWVAEKWAIKRNTWENRRDSTQDQGTCFFFSQADLVIQLTGRDTH